ncbi:MAG: DUF3135 domain-containing protein [Oceanobacter sp.]
MDLPSFDELRNLAENSPEQLEALRQQLIEETISQAPADCERRLRGLQFQIDMERRRAKTPMASCIRISKLMHDQLHKLKASIHGMQNYDEASDLIAETSTAPANNLIYFPEFANSGRR